MSDGLSGAADAICGSEASYGIWAASIASRSSWERRAKACGRSLDSEPSGVRVRACLGGVDVGAAICGTACFCFDLWLTCGIFWLILVESTLAVLSRPRDIGQRAPVAPHTRGRDEMRRGHLSATTLYGRDPAPNPEPGDSQASPQPSAALRTNHPMHATMHMIWHAPYHATCIRHHDSPHNHSKRTRHLIQIQTALPTFLRCTAVGPETHSQQSSTRVFGMSASRAGCRQNAHPTMQLRSRSRRLLLAAVR